MRLDSVKIRGIGPFRDEVKLDMADLGDAVLVAVCGDNGEGKSTLLEFALPGAFYRTTPSQGSIKDRARTRDALLEVVVTGAERFTLRHLMDGDSGKGTSVVLNHAGKPVYGNALVSSFDAWAARTLPPQDVLLASTFGSQGDAGFLGASASDRKGILLRALGISRYESWAKLAGEKARASKQSLEVARARLEEALRTGGDVKALTAAVEAAAMEANRLDGELSSAKAELSLAEETVREAEVAAAAFAAHETKQAELRARRQSFEAKRVDLDGRIAACNRTLAQEAAIREAGTKLEGLKREIDELVNLRTRLNSREEAAQERQRTARSQADEARKHAARVASRVAELRVVLARAAEIAQAAAHLNEVEAGLVTLREGVTSAQAALDELTAGAVTTAEGRVQGLRLGLEVISSSIALEDAVDLATGCLGADDATALEASERPAKLAAARKRLEDCRALLAASERRQQQLATLGRRSGEVTAAKSQIASLEAELNQHAETVRAQTMVAEQAEAQARLCNQELNAAGERHRTLNAQADQLRALADQLPNIALAASKLEERKAQLAEVAGEIEAATWALDQLGPAPARAAVPDLAPIRAKLSRLEQDARAAHQAVAVASSKLDSARAMEQQVRALEGQQRAEEAELADWTRLAEDLGRNGLQAAEIDGAGPELTALVNDLLHSCHGPRWSVRIDTQLLSADGKKTLEGCRVTVIDSVDSREDEGSKYSGGQKVIIGEACALGLSMLAVQRSGLRGITLVRDESGAALDPGNAEVYVKMLRRAAKQIAADRVLFVCHSAEVQELADARITVSNGRLLIDAQPSRAVA